MGLNPRLVGQVFRLETADKSVFTTRLNPRLVGQVFRRKMKIRIRYILVS